jgi:hypothetical protein
VKGQQVRPPGRRDAEQRAHIPQRDGQAAPSQSIRVIPKRLTSRFCGFGSPCVATSGFNGGSVTQESANRLPHLGFPETRGGGGRVALSDPQVGGTLPSAVTTTVGARQSLTG